MSNEKLAEIRVLAARLQNAAYDHGGIDASDRWSAKKYADADDRSRAALTTLMDKVSEALQAHAAEAAQAQAQNSEWVMVPREPTQAMLDANGDCDFPEGKAWLEKDARTTWAAILAAAPQPQAAEPVYQVREYEDDFWVWVDADAHRYSTADPKRRRVLYTHPQPSAQDAKDAARLQALLDILPTRTVLDEWLGSDLFGDGSTGTTLDQFRSAIDAAMPKESGR